MNLLYHNIVLPIQREIYQKSWRDRKYILDASDFEKQLAIIAQDVNASKINISFDDGRVNAYDTAAPLLEKLDVKAQFFITTGHIGRETFLDIKQIKELYNAGHCIGSHSHTHPDRMDSLTTSQIIYELETSKKILSDITGSEIECFSVPGGWYSPILAKLASEVGYKRLYTSNPLQKSIQIGYTLTEGRIPVDFTSAALLKNLLDHGWFKWYLNGKWAVKNTFRKVF